MLKDFLDSLIRKGRETQTTIVHHGAYRKEIKEATYSDGDGDYTVTESTKYEIGVSNINSLISSVKEEARRRENKTGDLMTVSFDLKGGWFCPEDNFRQAKYNYRRILSAQWQSIVNNLDKQMSHAELLLVVQLLKPTFFDPDYYQATFLAMREFKTSINIEHISKPTLVNGTMGYCTRREVTLKNGEKKTIDVPEEITLTAPFAKGSKQLYNFPITILPIDKGDNGGVYFNLICPTLETIIEQAIFDEIKEFKSQTTELDQLLILENY